MAKQYDSGRLSHAYIISSASRQDGLREAARLAAAAVCTEANAPCGLCRNCRKVFKGVHPDVITVSRLTDDSGRQKREINVDQIRQVSTDACVLPNEAARKVYIIDEADTMNVPAQNAALKLLEEPPAGAMFILCVSNADRLLPTVRSRCTEAAVAGETEGSGEYRELAEEYLKAVASGDAARLCRWCTAGDAMDTRAAAEFTDSVSLLTADILCGRAKNPGLSAQELLHISALTDKCRTYLKVNTGVKHIFGLLAVDSIAGGGK